MLNTFFSSVNRMLRTGMFRSTAASVALLSSSVATIQAHADYQFMEAYEASRRGDVETLANLQYNMQGSLFAMYPEYWILNSGLVNQPIESVEQFAQNYWQTVMGEKLAADFAEASARAGNYYAIQQIAPKVTNADRSEACALALGQNGTGDSMGALSLKNKVFLAAEKQPKLCHKLGDELINNPLITNEDVLQRLRVMLRANKTSKAAQAAQRLGLSGITYQQLNYVKSSPENYMLTTAAQTQEEQLLYLYALARQAKSFVGGAAQQLEFDQAKLDPATLAYGYRILAMAAMDKVVAEGFDNRVVEWFDKSASLPFSREEADDYGRVAARFGSWQSVLRAVDAMSPEQQKERTWQYWFARASEQLGTADGRKAAMAFYNSLAIKNDYYGLLSRDRLGLVINQLPTAYQPNQADFLRMQNDPHFQRAFTLYNSSAPKSYAKREWNWAVRQARLAKDDGKILAAASQAKDITWYDRAIYAADNTLTKSNAQLAYLTPFESEVKYYSQQVGLDPAWAYGIMRQESRFQGAARSHVGASGLMQIMPGTGRFIARKLGEGYSRSKLRDMDTNIRWGTFYLSHIQGELQGSTVLATAGYNAGPSRARRWQPDFQEMPADQYVEGIPFNETRDYVKKVMTNAVHYGLLFNQGPQSITQRMGTIPVKHQFTELSQ